jgi:alkylated DNA nucleotide flippase Atl1
VRADGSIGGYGGGVPRKVELLHEEGVDVIDGIIDLQRFGFQFPV